MKKIFYLILTFGSLILTNCVETNSKEQKEFTFTVISQKIGTKVPEDIISICTPLSNPQCSNVEFIANTKSSLIRIENNTTCYFISKSFFVNFLGSRNTAERTTNNLHRTSLSDTFNLPNKEFSIPSLTKHLNDFDTSNVFVFSKKEKASILPINGKNYKVYNSFATLKTAIETKLCSDYQNKELKCLLIYDIDLDNNIPVLVLAKTEEDHRQRVDSIKILKEDIKKLIESRQSNSTSPQIKEKFKIIEKLLSQDSILLSTVKTKLKNAKTEKAVLEVFVDELKSKQEEINELYRKNGILQKERDEWKDQAVQTKKEKERIERNRDSLKTENEKTRTIAKKLKIADTKLTFYEKNWGKIKEIKGRVKARSVIKIQLCFHVLENEFANSKNYTTYIRIYDNNGNVISPSSETFEWLDTRSGKLSDLAFTLKKGFNFDKREQVLCLDWDISNIKLAAGKYEIKYFIDKEEVGRREFSLE